MIDQIIPPAATLCLVRYERRLCELATDLSRANERGEREWMTTFYPFNDEQLATLVAHLRERGYTVAVHGDENNTLTIEW